MTGSKLRGAALLLLCAPLISCGDSNAPPAPTPGVVDVYLVTPNAEDRAALIHVGGAVTGFTPATGMQHFQTQSGSATSLLVVSAAALPAGETRIGSLAVPDTSRIAAMTATLAEVARTDYGLREPLAGYTVRLTKR